MLGGWDIRVRVTQLGCYKVRCPRVKGIKKSGFRRSGSEREKKLEVRRSEDHGIRVLEG